MVRACCWLRVALNLRANRALLGFWNRPECSTQASSSSSSSSSGGADEVVKSSPGNSLPLSFQQDCGDGTTSSLRLSANVIRSNRDVYERIKEGIKFAKRCYDEGSSEALKVLVEYVRGDRRVAKTSPHRVLYYAIQLALIRNELNTAAELFELAPKRVHVLGTSLRVRYLSRTGRVQEALSQLEEVLNEDVPLFDTSTKLADEALDELCAAIKAKPDSVLEMRRFRYLQRLVTKYERRTKLTIEQLLNSEVFDGPPKGKVDETPERLDEKTLEKIVRIAPHVLSDD